MTQIERDGRSSLPAVAGYLGPEPELDGLKVVVSVLERLRPEERVRVMRYLVDRYGPNAAR